MGGRPQEEDRPSESRPYKQYCTTLLALVKAETILIGSCLQGDVEELHFPWEIRTLPSGVEEEEEEEDKHRQK